MARKFGKKNVIKIDPLAYNLGLIGESGIGKTTLAKEVCEKLVGEDGYMIANVGMEDGIDAIAGAIYEDIPDWDTFEEFVDEIIENKMTDYKDLKAIVWDTIDELIRISEPEAIRLYNIEQNQKGKKTAKTIKQAWGGYGEGEKFTINLIMRKLWELKRAGVAMFLVGHTKKRTLNDPLSGLDYDILTTNMQHNYFNALKTKLHILGVASINREITQNKTGKKDFNGKDKIQGRVDSESRRITFRDDNFSVDSKSRFSQIIDDINFDPDLYIEAITEAIKIEHDKQGSSTKSISEIATEQEKEREETIRKNVQKKREELEAKEMNEIREKLSNFIKTYKLKDAKMLKPLLLKAKEFDLSNPCKVSDLDQARELEELVDSVS